MNIMTLSNGDQRRFKIELLALETHIQDLLWGSDVFRELAMTQVPMPEGDDLSDEFVNACSEIQGEMISAVLIKLLAGNNNFA